MALHPLLFHPLPQARIWGGRRLEELYRRTLPAGPVGESWEISDRPEAVSVVAEGPLAGRSLRWLMDWHGRDLIGELPASGGRFPWLVKIIDARDNLSLQVHPPADKAAALGGETKSELWFAADAAPGARIFAGLRRGVTRSQFEAAAGTGDVARCFHEIPWKRGDALFLPSGRAHALGGGSVIFEIQQNSDTTYRVFDWNRKGLDGRPRELHLAASLESIDFGDFEPSLAPGVMAPAGPGAERRVLVDCPLFRIEHWRVAAGTAWSSAFDRGPVVVGVVAGAVTIQLPAGPATRGPGTFVLMPACAPNGLAQAGGPMELLVTTPPGTR